MRVLVYIPQGRQVMASLKSVCALDTSGHEVSIWFDRENNVGNGEHGFLVGKTFDRWYEQQCVKMRRARQMVLRGGYDALMSIEDDIIVQPDALHMLDAVGADIAYGLAVWRNAPHKWSATLDMEWGSHVTTLDDDMQAARTAWGGTVETLGCGLFCTLIRRHVLEALGFRRVNPGAIDWGLAYDARDAGFSQVTHTGVVCGHISGDTALWPDPQMRFRVTSIKES